MKHMVAFNISTNVPKNCGTTNKQLTDYTQVMKCSATVTDWQNFIHSLEVLHTFIHQMMDKLQKMNGTKCYSLCFQYAYGHEMKNY